ncbi:MULTISPECIES: hypothetical protein [Peribacillus]|uniref:hypothetical protein n=1 Tax=Peribacillus TaxID=2675229 RepID=UPI001F4E8452|nr:MULTISPECIES: hypothetical protein [unclassified Peribacillus]MCK1981984.1 hypothetical protein [Peribacillus sp. Aquil_B1]MCK2007664.1 hypothetical protein [Peribacillus sp. Aquil_B8]
MPNIKMQEATVVVHGGSRFNNSYDTVMVHTTIITDAPLTDEYFVPSGSSLSNEAIALIKKHGLEFRPYRETDLLTGTEDVLADAISGNIVETEKDVAKLLLRSSLLKGQLTQVTQAGSSYVYELRYDYKIFPQENGSYQFEIRLPFDGTRMLNGSSVQLTVITPKGVTVNDVETKGLDENGLEIQEQITQLTATNRLAVSFHYQLDPLFIVNYTHTEPYFQG